MITRIVDTIADRVPLYKHTNLYPEVECSRCESRRCAYCGLGDAQYEDGSWPEWYKRDDDRWAHRRCSPRE